MEALLGALLEALLHPAALPTLTVPIASLRCDCTLMSPWPMETLSACLSCLFCLLRLLRLLRLLMELIMLLIATIATILSFLAIHASRENIK